jgi:hypothetical protein
MLHRVLAFCSKVFCIPGIRLLRADDDGNDCWVKRLYSRLYATSRLFFDLLSLLFVALSFEADCNPFHSGASIIWSS